MSLFFSLLFRKFWGIFWGISILDEKSTPFYVETHRRQGAQRKAPRQGLQAVRWPKYVPLHQA